jgi:hypothetical protein
MLLLSLAHLQAHPQSWLAAGLSGRRCCGKWLLYCL